MKKGQSNIFYLAGSSVAEIETSPFLERLNARGYEVLYLEAPIDEYVAQSLVEFEGVRLQNIAKEGLKFGDEDDDQSQFDETTEKFEPLTSWIAKVLSSFIDKAVISNRLTTSPVAVVVPQFGLSGNMERIMKAQAYGSNSDPTASFYANQKKTLEINPKHPVIIELLNRISSDQIDENTEELIQILYDTAMLRSGFIVQDTVAFASRVERILRQNLDVDLNATIEVNEKPAPEKTAEDHDSDDEDDDEHDHDHHHGHHHDHDHGHDEL